jgi:hypothetical protein
MLLYPFDSKKEMRKFEPQDISGRLPIAPVVWDFLN